MKFISIAIFFRKLTTETVDLWFQVREEDGPLSGLLEFPGGKVEPGETPRECCSREVAEEVGFEGDERVSFEQDLAFFKFYPFEYTDRKVKLHVFLSPIEVQSCTKKGMWKTLEFKNKSKPIAQKILPANVLIIDDVLDFLTVSEGYQNLDGAWRRLSQSQNFF